MSSDFSYFFTCQKESSVGLHDFISCSLPHLKKKRGKKRGERAFGSPRPSPCLLSPLRVPVMYPFFFCFSLAPDSYSSFSSLSFCQRWFFETGATGLLRPRAGAIPGAPPPPPPPRRRRIFKHGPTTRPLLFGCAEVCINSSSFNRSGSGACGHGYTWSFALLCLRVLFAVRSYE